MNKKIRTVGTTMIIVGVTLLLSLALVLVFGYDFVLNPGTTVKPIEFEAEQTPAAEHSDPGNIVIPGFTVWNIPAGETNVDSAFYNPEKNQCYFVLTVTLDNGEEVIYQSKYLKPGQRLYQVDLIRPLEAGEYAAVLTYDTYSTDDYSPMNGAAVPFTLSVK